MFWELGIWRSKREFQGTSSGEEHAGGGETPACETNSSDMQLGGDLCKVPMCKAVAQGETTLHLHA